MGEAPNPGVRGRFFGDGVWLIVFEGSDDLLHFLDSRSL